MKTCPTCRGMRSGAALAPTDRGLEEHDEACLDCDGDGSVHHDPRDASDRAEVATLFVDDHGPLVALYACGLRGVVRPRPALASAAVRAWERLIVEEFGVEPTRVVGSTGERIDDLMRGAIAHAALEHAIELAAMLGLSNVLLNLNETMTR